MGSATVIEARDLTVRSVRGGEVGEAAFVAADAAAHLVHHVREKVRRSRSMKIS